MRQTIIMVASAALLGFGVSGCATGSFQPNTSAKMASIKVAAAEAEPIPQKPTGGDDDHNVLAHLLAFAAPKASAVSPVNFPPPRQARPALDPLIAKYALAYGVPERLIRRVIMRESGYNPGARNGPYYGLMQISHATARSMGYHGSPGGLLDAETNLRYAGKYLRGAYITARGNEDQAMRFYASGYYYDAKRAGLLKETGLR